MNKYVMINSLEGVVDCVKENETRLNRKITLVALVGAIGLTAAAMYNKDLTGKIEKLKNEIKELKNERG